MKNTLTLALSATLLAASSASAAIGTYSDDFESYTVGSTTANLTDSANWTSFTATEPVVLAENLSISGDGSGQMADADGGVHGAYHPGITLGAGESFTAEMLVSWEGTSSLGGLTIGGTNTANYHSVLLGNTGFANALTSFHPNGGSNVIDSNDSFTTADNTWYRLTVSGNQGDSTISVSVFDTVADEYKIQNLSMDYGPSSETIASGIQFGFLSFAANAHKYDDFSITVIPEARSSGLILALAALALIGARRRRC